MMTLSGKKELSPAKNSGRSYSFDDSKVDYLSILGLEDKKRRFSEDVVDMELKDSVKLKKIFRQIQRDVHCHHSKEGEVIEAQCNGSLAPV